MGPRLSRPAPYTRVYITSFTGGTQQNTTITLADVTGSDMPLAVGMYDFCWSITYSAGATATGANFSVNGNAGLVATTLEFIATGDVLTTDSSTRSNFVFNQGVAFTSSRGVGANRGTVRGSIRVGTAGTLVLRFASEVAGSAIGIVGLDGWYERR